MSAGEDPLLDHHSDHDINSVAGVLKLYFRGLENPLFPKERFLDLISTTSELHSGKTHVCRLLVFYLCCVSRAGLGGRTGSPPAADHGGSSAPRGRRHEIPVRLPEPVGLLAAGLGPL